MGRGSADALRAECPATPGPSAGERDARIPVVRSEQREDPVLLITGASSGIGAATARAAAPNYRLVLAARRLEELDVLSGELGGTERALPVRCDVTEWDQVEALTAKALKDFGRIDAVFANAG